MPLFSFYINWLFLKFFVNLRFSHEPGLNSTNCWPLTSASARASQLAAKKQRSRRVESPAEETRTWAVCTGCPGRSGCGNTGFPATSWIPATGTGWIAFTNSQAIRRCQFPGTVRSARSAFKFHTEIVAWFFWKWSGPIVNPGNQGFFSPLRFHEV